MIPAALIFDLDGTLANTLDAHCRSWREALQEFDVPYTPQRMEQLCGVPLADTINLLLHEAGIERNPIAILALKEQRFYHYLAQGVTATPLVSQVVAYYHGRLPMAIGTGCTTEMALRILEALNIRHYFDTIVGADTVEHPKPAPDTFLYASEHLQVPACRCLVFEDADNGIVAAHAAGMRVHDVRQGWPNPEDLAIL